MNPHWQAIHKFVPPQESLDQQQREYLEAIKHVPKPIVKPVVAPLSDKRNIAHLIQSLAIAETQKKQILDESQRQKSRLEQDLNQLRVERDQTLERFESTQRELLEAKSLLQKQETELQVLKSQYVAQHHESTDETQNYLKNLDSKLSVIQSEIKVINNQIPKVKRLLSPKRVEQKETKTVSVEPDNPFSPEQKKIHKLEAQTILDQMIPPVTVPDPSPLKSHQKEHPRDTKNDQKERKQQPTATHPKKDEITNDAGTKQSEWTADDTVSSNSGFEQIRKRDRNGLEQLLVRIIKDKQRNTDNSIADELDKLLSQTTKPSAKRELKKPLIEKRDEISQYEPMPTENQTTSISDLSESVSVLQPRQKSRLYRNAGTNTEYHQKPTKEPRESVNSSTRGRASRSSGNETPIATLGADNSRLLNNAVLESTRLLDNSRVLESRPMDNNRVLESRPRERARVLEKKPKEDSPHSSLPSWHSMQSYIITPIVADGQKKEHSLAQRTDRSVLFESDTSMLKSLQEVVLELDNLPREKETRFLDPVDIPDFLDQDELDAISSLNGL